MKRTVLVAILTLVPIGLSLVAVAYHQNWLEMLAQVRKTKISSTSLLTDETTGKGIISIGGHIQDVREVLIRYETDEGSLEQGYNYLSSGEECFFFGGVQYFFDADGRLTGYVSGTGICSFETSRGLRVGDPVARMFELYGTDYTFDGDIPSGPPIYTYIFGNTGMNESVSADTRDEGDMSGVVYSIGCGEVR